MCAAVPRGGITPIAPDIAPVIAPVIAAVTGATSEGWSVCGTEAVERRRQTDMSKRGTDHEEQGGGRAIGGQVALSYAGAEACALFEIESTKQTRGFVSEMEISPPNDAFKFGYRVPK